MKKLLLILVTLLNTFIGKSQNYQCLQPAVKHYFINGDHYLRGVRVDSFSMSGDTTVYHLYRTERGSCMGTMYLGPCDTNGGSWLGHRVLQCADGTFIFDNRWGNNVVIKPQATIGDSWTMYSDSSNLHYEASVAGIDTMTVLGVLDSVKRLYITANDTTGIVTTDSITGFEIWLSKDHGFVQICDLYTFPYHRADSVYRVGLDHFLDVCTRNIYAATYEPGSNNALFKIVPLTPPNDIAMHNWNVGDIFEQSYYGGFWPSPASNGYFMDSIVSKVTTGHKTVYGISGWKSESGILTPRSGSLNFYDTVFSIVDSIKMPEERTLNKPFVYYYPADTSQCVISDAFKTFYYGYTYIWYKTNIGRTSYYSMDEMAYFSDTSINSYKMASHVCGNLPAPVFVENISGSLPTIELHPNPAKGNIIITSDQQLGRLEVTDLVGRILYSTNCNSHNLSIDVTAFPSGLYLVHISNSLVQRFVKE